jgi:type IV secretory pathway protease TraF
VHAQRGVDRGGGRKEQVRRLGVVRRREAAADVQQLHVKAVRGAQVKRVARSRNGVCVHAHVLAAAADVERHAHHLGCWERGRVVRASRCCIMAAAERKR